MAVLLPTIKPTQLDLHKAAGWWAGEGHVGSANRGLHVSVAQKEISVLLWFQERFGGSVHTGKPQMGRAPTSAWNLFGRPARRFLLSIYKLIPESPRRQGQIKKHILFTAGKRKTGPVAKPFCRLGHPKTPGRGFVCKTCRKIYKQRRKAEANAA